jgi:hypothetical protein
LTSLKRLKVGKFNALPGNTPLWALGIEKGRGRERKRESRGGRVGGVEDERRGGQGERRKGEQGSEKGEREEKKGEGGWSEWEPAGRNIFIRLPYL